MRNISRTTIRILIRIIKPKYFSRIMWKFIECSQMSEVTLLWMGQVFQEQIPVYGPYFENDVV
jgi:hypothetical protein